jgi:hypothetical protein
MMEKMVPPLPPVAAVSAVVEALVVDGPVAKSGRALLPPWSARGLSLLAIGRTDCNCSSAATGC